MTADDLAMRPATALLEGFRRKEFSPVETTKALIDRAEKSAATINAFTYTYFDEALAAAREAESRYIGKGEAPRPLEGLCVAIKDSGHIAGQPTSAGSLTMTDDPQPATSPINQQVLEAGGIVHARSATPRIFLCAVHPVTPLGGNAEPAEYRLFPRRVFRRGGGGTGLRQHEPCHRIGYRRVDPCSGIMLRCCWL